MESALVVRCLACRAAVNRKAADECPFCGTDVRSMPAIREVPTAVRSDPSPARPSRLHAAARSLVAVSVLVVLARHPNAPTDVERNQPPPPPTATAPPAPSAAPTPIAERKGAVPSSSRPVVYRRPMRRMAAPTQAPPVAQRRSGPPKRPQNPAAPQRPAK